MIRVWQRILVCLLVALAAVSATAVVRAEGEQARQQGAELKRLGDQAMDEMRYADAIDAYDRAYDAYPDPAVLYNRGRAREARGEVVEALRDLRRFRDTANQEVRSRVPGLEELIDEVEAQIGLLVVVCPVVGATVRVAGEAVGRTPLLQSLEVPAGKVEVEVTAKGRVPFRSQVEIRGREEHHLRVVLPKVETTAVLSVRSPGRAQVLVDGKNVGATPAEVRVAPGRHQVVVRAPSRHDAEATVVVEAGERREFQLEPERRPPLLARWWFWTGIGVVAAATATTLALTLEKQPDEGENFAPGQIPGPLVVRY
ncbi:MAG: PEGA domain-containing protein [Polyangiaceae bacterium]|nr:PEGA domain-containing protein [Polyangiaceae bacterium]